MKEMSTASRLAPALGVLLGAVLFPATAQPPLPEILSRVAEEAETFQQNAPKTLTQETLVQRASMPPSRFRPRVGKAATVVPKARVQTREIVSEYSLGTLRDSESSNLIEFRQVVSVDGRPLQSAEAARHALSLGVHSSDDRLRKRMLEDFARHGLVDIATDYATIILAFTRRGQAEMRIAPAGEDRIGPDEALLLNWQQTSSAEGALEFHGRQVARRALQGTLWVRRSDGLPLRVSAWLEHPDPAKHIICDEATIDYVLSTHGFLTPVSVLHRHYVDKQLVTENLYRYEPFKMFAADADIKFTEVPDPATLPPAKK